MAGLLWPIVGHHMTQRFAGEHPFEPSLFLSKDPIGPRRARASRFPNSVLFPHLHGAIDISCGIGTPVRAPEAGRIVRADNFEKTGENFMLLEVKPGTILFFTHLSKFLVKEGKVVKRGQEIALSGNSGMSTGPHLHWEVRISTKANPDFTRSWRWFKWNPRRLRVGGDLAGLRAIVPPGLEVEPPPPDPIDEPEPPEPEDPLGGPPEDMGGPVEPIDTETDPDPEDDPVDDGEPDEFGDGATLLDPPKIEPHPGGPVGHM